MRVLIIEDDPQLNDFIKQGLQQAGHTVEQCFDGKAGLIEASSEPFDVIVLDRQLPKMNGLDVLKALHSMGSATPVLMLSHLGDADHKVEGLRSGCDDYLSKPFSFAELLARLEVLAKRRPQADETQQLVLADLTLDLLRRQAQRGGQTIELLTREFKLLEYLLRHQGQVVTKTMLLEHIWQLNFDPQTNVVEVHISRLRQKIDKGFQPALLHTVRGAGYVLRVMD
ncbi:DNA-binding response regulator [Bacterioplanes sanyensis]|uniref:DNA-binding response regulator n=1 Tax=Bacterioplanes sanyensis TaxID=1249553 RepID=A0A222FFP2_9GAMM|nr:response regulator transcription factor [Bacterioplanes sanyensis]ASP37590.1 DNA-binding response regulator [Bacterioplanes sanyensis]